MKNWFNVNFIEFCKFKTLKIYTAEFEILNLWEHPFACENRVSRTGDENGRWRCLWSQNALQRDSAMQYRIFQHTSTQEIILFKVFGCSLTYINSDDTTTHTGGFWNNAQVVFRRIAQLPFALQVGKASSLPEARSLLWLIMMSSAHLYTAALTNSGRFTSIYSGLMCRLLASSIRIFSTAKDPKSEPGFYPSILYSKLNLWYQCDWIDKTVSCNWFRLNKQVNGNTSKHWN